MRNWAVGAIEPPSHYPGPYCPDLEKIALDITGRNNTAAAVELLNGWHASLVAHAHENLHRVGLSKHCAKLDVVVKRPDCTTEMVYNFLLNLGGDVWWIVRSWREMLFDTLIPAAQKESEDYNRHAPREDQEQRTQGSDPLPSESPNPPEPVLREVNMSDLHRTITEALDRIGVSYHRSEDGNTYGFVHEGIVLMVAARAVDENMPAAVLIQAVVLEKVECTRELMVDLLERNGRTMFAAWLIDSDSWITEKRQPDGMVKVTLGYDLSAEQLDAGLVERLVGRVLSTAVSAANELQSAHGGERPVIVAEEQPVAAEKPPEPTIMPQGPITYTGRYPGYEPKQAMETFFSASAEHERPSYEEGRDFWAFDGGGYWIVVGCFVEPDGTPVIVLTCFSKSAHSAPPMEPFMDEFFSVIQQSADSTHVVLPDEEITESSEAGTLRQLRPSELDGGAPNPT
jgi:hypothetical protein